MPYTPLTPKVSGVFIYNPCYCALHNVASTRKYNLQPGISIRLGCNLQRICA
ncbi:hypothetical protein SCACP_10240 [Sporomusa carbonis]